MRLKVLGSDSKGNCYILENENTALIIECGIKFIEVKKALNFDISKIVGVLVSHSHKDHCNYIKEYLKAGITVYANKNTINEVNFPYGCHWCLKPIYNKKMFNVNDYSVIPLDLPHDVQNSGFLIKHPETGSFCFMTDFHYSPYKFDHLNNIIIECNYDHDILEDNILNDRLPVIVRNQVLYSHFSFEACRNFLAATDLSNVVNIVLIHVSKGNGNPKTFKKEIEKLTNKNVHIAEKGMDIEFNKEPF